MPSRNEQYLEAAVNKSGTDGLPEPRTRNEKLLHRLVEEVSNRTHWAEESMIDIFPEQTLEFINNEGTYGVEIPIDLFSFGIQKNGGKRKLVIDVDVENAPEQYRIKQPDAIDGDSIREYLKENGLAPIDWQIEDRM